MFRLLKTRDAKEAQIHGTEQRIHTSEMMAQKQTVHFKKLKERYFKWLKEHELEGIRYKP